MAASFLSNCRSLIKRLQSTRSRAAVPSVDQDNADTPAANASRSTRGLREKLTNLLVPLSGIASPLSLLSVLAIAVYLLARVDDYMLRQEAQHAENSPPVRRLRPRSHLRTDEALLRLARPERATFLLLNGSDITNRGLEVLHKTQRLVMLEMNHTNATGASLRTIGRLRELQGLFLRYAVIEDDDLIHLKGSPLRNLNLAGTLISDAGLQHLLALPRLKHLSLNDTAVTDEGLETIQKLPSLTSLRVRGTAVTEQGVQALRAARNDLKISWDGRYSIR